MPGEYVPSPKALAKCRAKVKRDLEGALREANDMRTKPVRAMRYPHAYAYWCPCCGYWHTTSGEPK